MGPESRELTQHGNMRGVKMRKGGGKGKGKGKGKGNENESKETK